MSNQSQALGWQRDQAQHPGLVATCLLLLFSFPFFLAVQGIKLRAYVLGKQPATELYPRPSLWAATQAYKAPVLHYSLDVRIPKEPLMDVAAKIHWVPVLTVL